MTPSPLELTPEQRQRIYNDRAQRFMDGLQKLTEETGLVLMPQIEYTPQGAMIILSVVDRPIPSQPLDNPSVPSV